MPCVSNADTDPFGKGRTRQGGVCIPPFSGCRFHLEYRTHHSSEALDGEENRSTLEPPEQTRSLLTFCDTYDEATSPEYTVRRRPKPRSPLAQSSFRQCRLASRLRSRLSHLLRLSSIIPERVLRLVLVQYLGRPTKSNVNQRPLNEAMRVAWSLSCILILLLGFYCGDGDCGSWVTDEELGVVVGEGVWERNW